MAKLEEILLRLTRPAVLGVLLIAFCAGIVFATHLSYTSWQTSHQSIRQLRLAADAVEQDMHLFHHLRGAFGYGGFIHHFKNFVLHGDAESRLAAEQDHHHLMMAITNARNSMRQPESQEALDEIAVTIQAYADLLPVVQQGWDDGLPIKEIDSLTQVDDSAAINALNSLDHMMMTTMSGTEQPFIAAAQTSGRMFVLSSMASVLIAVLGFAALVLIRKISKMLGVTTEQARALEQSNIRYRNILATAADGIIIASERGLIEDVNQAAERMFGYAREELLGQNLKILMGEGDAAVHDMHLSRYRHTHKSAVIGATKRQMLFARRKNGEFFPVEIHLSMAETPTGRVFTGVVSDVTEQREYENSLRRSDTGMREAQRIAKIGSWELDLASGELYWSDEIYRIFGQEPGAFTPSYEAFFGVVHPDDRDRVLASEERAKIGDLHDVEHRIIRADGEVRWVHELAEMTFAADGVPLRMNGTVQDITERKLAQEELNRFKSTLDLTADCVFMFNPHNLRFFYVNQGAMNQVGYSGDELLRMTPLDLKPDYDEKQFRSLIEPLMSGANNQQTIETRHQHKDGHGIPVEVSLQYVAPLGEPPRFVAIVRDITARKQAEEMQRRETDNLKVLNEISSLTANTLEHRLANALQRASEHLRMEVGIISRIDGARYSIENFVAPPDLPLHIDQVFELGNTYCDLTVQENGVVAIERMVDSPYAGHPCYREFPLEAYIGVPLAVNGSFYGTVNFSSRRPYVRGFTESDREFMRLLAAWVGATIEREWTLRRLQFSEQRLQSSQTFANIGTWDWSIQTGDLYWSDRIAPLFGYAKGELETTYDNFLLAVHPDDRQKVIDAVTACVEKGVTYDIEHRVVWPDGSVRWMLERGDVVRAADGAPLNMLGVVQDITDRKTAEDRLRESERRLREAQRIGRIGNWTWEVATGQLTWSDEIFDIFALAPDSVVPSYDLFMSYVHPDDVEAVKLSEQHAFAVGKMHSIDHRIVLSDGTIRWVHEEAESLLDDNGQPLRLLGTVQDITERKRNEEELLAAKDAAERANRAKSDFLSSMSHELRTPMNAILGFSQLLEVEPLTDEQKDYNKEILRAGRHLLELINEVLDLAKVESGRIDLSLEPVECNELIQECLTLIRPLAEQNSIQLSYHPPARAIAMRADRTRLKQVLLNLLSNAVKYNRSGGTVDISLMRLNDGLARLGVRDTGLGIAAKDMERLFEAFNRLHAEHSEIEGTGIGLVISKRLIEMMGGSIGVDSRYGTGSHFWLELPEEQLMNSAHADMSADGLQVQVDYTATVLYIEDNPANLKLVSMLLTKRPHVKLITAHLPEIGLELARNTQPDIILLDINMPAMDGYEVLRSLQDMPETCKIPVIAITANAMPKDIARGKEAGFYEYLTKPIDVSMFYATLDHWLEHAT